MSNLFTTESGHSMPNLAEDLPMFRRARKSLPLPSTARPARGFGMALSAVVFAVIVIACGSDSGTSAAAPDAARNTPTDVLEPCVEDGYCGSFAVGGRLLTAAWLDDERMYLTDTEGRIRLLNVDTGDIETVLEGLTIPQGLTVLGGRIYVSELNNFCQLTKELTPQDSDECPRPPSMDYRDAQKDFLSRVDARILSYRIDETGGLDDRRIVVDRLPAWTNRHSPNGLTNDGEHVYASIGNILHHRTEYAHYADLIDELGDRSPRMDLNGVIARFRPPDGEVEVFASGFRNVYGLSFAPDGTIYGADNDDGHIGGVVARHREELNAIVEGGFYGYPHWGTNEAPPEEQVIEPVAVLQGRGSTYAHANSDGVYVASACRDCDYIEESGYIYEINVFDYETWTPKPIFRGRTYITSIMERGGLFYLTELSDEIGVHVIDPRVAALPIYAPSAGPFRNNEYVSTIISSASPIIQSGYDVYLDDGRLLYMKSSCSQADRTTRFFLHVIPVDTNDFDEGGAKHGFDNLDFTFITGQGWRAGNSCYLVVELPEYQIREIRTGQFAHETEGYANAWDAEYRFEQ